MGTERLKPNLRVLKTIAGAIKCTDRVNLKSGDSEMAAVAP